MNRKAHWEQVYREQAPHSVSWYQRTPELSLALIAKTGVSPDAWIIDVGAGASMLVDHLLEAGYRHLAVLDISAAALAHARQRLGPKADRVEWYEADITEFQPPRSFDVWHDRAVFHFLTEPAERARYAAALRRTLKPGGHAIVATFAVGGPTRCSGLDIVQYDGAALLRELGSGFTLQEEVGEVHLTPGGREQPFTYFRLSRSP
ncbi:MAG TPA: class I SAM-dependent methyltransferase [Burkholderiales bacterium]